MQEAERRLRRVVWAGTAALALFALLRFWLPRLPPRGAVVSRDANGAASLRDAEGRVLLDPWERPYVYLDPTPEHPRPRVISLGADGVPGGEGENADIDSDELPKELR